jgi:thiosulfate/3-mercaptopyruvate sulfurtransferase
MLNRKWYIGLLLVAALALSACAAPGSAPAAGINPAAGNPVAAASEPAAPTEYVNPDILVDTDWVLENLQNPDVRLIDVSSQAEAYEEGHIPGAVYIHPGSRLTNPEDSTQGQILTQDALSELFSEVGVTHDTTVVLYDNSNNLWASRAYWSLKYYQHDDVRIYNGGKNRWVADGQELATEAPEITPTEYVARDADPDIRTTTEYILERLDDDSVMMCDTRNPEEYAGTDVRADRGGHIPGAINIDWIYNVDDNGLFKSAEELYALYTAAGFSPDKQIITYCQTGVRGAHTWFVLRELLGFPDVRNYDGSWAEYGNRDDTPIQS